MEKSTVNLLDISLRTSLRVEDGEKVIKVRVGAETDGGGSFETSFALDNGVDAYTLGRIDAAVKHHGEEILKRQLTDAIGDALAETQAALEEAEDE